MPVFVIAKPLADGGARDVVLEAITLDRWRGAYPQAIAEIGGEIIGNAAAGVGLSLLIARPGNLLSRRRRAHSAGRARRIFELRKWVPCEPLRRLRLGRAGLNVAGKRRSN